MSDCVDADARRRLAVVEDSNATRRETLSRMSVQLAVVKTDVRWIKRGVGAVCGALLAALLGLGGWAASKLADAPPRPLAAIAPSP